MSKLNYFEGTRPPGVTDDVSRGFDVNSTWIVGGRLYICTDPTTNAAKWSRFSEDHESWPPRSMRYPENFGSGLNYVTPAAVDTVYFFPFMIRRPIDQIGIGVQTLGSTGAEITLGLYPHVDMTGKPDGQTALNNLTTIKLDTGATGFRFGNFSVIDVRGLHWVAVWVKGTGITTMPSVIEMTNANGKYIHRGDGADLIALSPPKHLSGASGYISGSPYNAPTSTTVGSAGAPMPILRAT